VADGGGGLARGRGQPAPARYHSDNAGPARRERRGTHNFSTVCVLAGAQTYTAVIVLQRRNHRLGSKITRKALAALRASKHVISVTMDGALPSVRY